MDYHLLTKKCDGMCDSCECPPAEFECLGEPSLCTNPRGCACAPDPTLKPDIAALKKRLAEDPGFAAQVTGEKAEMQPELALFFRDLRNYLLHVIDMSKGEHYLDVVRLNAQALTRRMELLAAHAQPVDRPLTDHERALTGAKVTGYPSDL